MEMVGGLGYMYEKMWGWADGQVGWEKQIGLDVLDVICWWFWAGVRFAILMRIWE